VKKEEEEDEWIISTGMTPSGLLQHDRRIYVAYAKAVRNTQFVKDKDYISDYI
jgi:lysyl-tRNA synthetase class I